MMIKNLRSCGVILKMIKKTGWDWRCGIVTDSCEKIKQETHLPLIGSVLCFTISYNHPKPKYCHVPGKRGFGLGSWGHSFLFMDHLPFLDNLIQSCEVSIRGEGGTPSSILWGCVAWKFFTTHLLGSSGKNLVIPCFKEGMSKRCHFCKILSNFLGNLTEMCSKKVII